MKGKNRTIVRGIILLVMFVAIAYTVYASLNRDDKTALVSEEAPNFKLQDLNGTSYELASLQGKGVVVTFFGTWCEPCKKEMPFINTTYNAYKDKGLEILAVNVGESTIAVENFAQSLELDFPVLMDKSGDVLSAYRVQPLPTTFFIDSEGVITRIVTGAMTYDVFSNYVGEIVPN